MNSATVGLGRQLRVPDDYFTLSNSLSYSQYQTQNYSLLTTGCSHRHVQQHHPQHHAVAQ
ncbi:MAG: hypothetical protein WKG07_33375 [Hymenobacter sp.]